MVEKLVGRNVQIEEYVIDSRFEILYSFHHYLDSATLLILRLCFFGLHPQSTQLLPLSAYFLVSLPSLPLQLNLSLFNSSLHLIVQVMYSVWYSMSRFQIMFLY